MKRIAFTVSLVVFAAILAGCAKDESKTGVSSASVDGTKYILTSEPEGAKTVIEARKDGENDKEIVVVGRIGGSENPWIEKRAAFSIVDPTLIPCSEIEGDACPTPWDYCCATDRLPTSTALVKIIDTSGNIVEADARELLKVKELQTVVVKGKAQRDESGNLTVLASGIYVRN